MHIHCDVCSVMEKKEENAMTPRVTNEENKNKISTQEQLEDQQ